VIALAVVLSLVAASPSEAEKAADEHFGRGVALAARGDYVASLAEFEAAYRLAPAWQVLFNLGVVREKLAEPALALEAFEAYLSKGGKAVPLDKRTLVEGEVASLRKQVGEVVVNVEGAAAQIEVDGLERGMTPLTAPVYVLPGRHRVVARRDSESAQTELEVHRGDRVVVALVPPSAAPKPVVEPPATEPMKPVVLTPAPAVVPEPAPVSAVPVVNGPPPKPWYQRWYVWAAVGAAVAGGIATAAVVASRPHYDVRVDTP
jgi:hypothetical protein